LTPKEQMEFHEKLSDSRYKLIDQLDALLHRCLVGNTYFISGSESQAQDIDFMTKIAGVRVHLFREILEMASLTQALRFSSPMGPAEDYQNWINLVDKGSQDEQPKEDK